MSLEIDQKIDEWESWRRDNLANDFAELIDALNDDPDAALLTLLEGIKNKTADEAVGTLIEEVIRYERDVSMAWEYWGD